MNESLSEQGATSHRAEQVRSLVRAISRASAPDEIDDVPLASLGIDSLDFFELVMQLEDLWHVQLDLLRLDDTLTTRDLIRLVEG